MSKPNHIIIVRHGQSEANVDRTLHAHKPDYRMNLTPAGHEQAKAAGAKIAALIGHKPKNLAIYCSPYFRTRQTRDGILSNFRPEEIYCNYEDPRLREQEFGNYLDPKTWEAMDIERTQYGVFYYRPPTGESGADVYDRCTGVLDTLYRDFQKESYPENALIVCHGLTIRLLLMRWLHWTVEEFEQKANPHNCQFFVLERQGNDKFKLAEPFPLRAPKT